MSEYNDKVVLVTGSSSGIGAAIAIEYAKQGANLVITGRNAEGLQKIADEIEKISKKNPLQIVGNIAEDCIQKKLIDDTIEKFGQLDILINNAGMFLKFDNIEHDQVIKSFDQVYAVNVRAPLHLIHLAAPHLEKTKGNIINISSIAALSPMIPIYCSSKAALDMITKTTAIQLAPKGIRINSVNPGPVITNIMRDVGLSEVVYEKCSSLVPTKFMAVGTDIANVVLFLTNNRLARNMTGSIVVSDSGVLLDPGCLRDVMKDLEEVK